MRVIQDISKTSLDTSVLIFFPNVEEIYANDLKHGSWLGPSQFRQAIFVILLIAIYRGNSHVKRFEFQYGTVSAVHRSAFRGLELSLETLSLAYGQLTMLHPSTFK